MRFQNPGSLGLTVWVFAITVLAVSFFGAGIKAQTELPDRVTVRGTVIDLNCASTGKALTGSWKNTELDHVMADGMLVVRMRQRADERPLSAAFGQQRQMLAHLHARSLRGDGRKFPADVVGGIRFGIEAVVLRESAGKEYVNDVFCRRSCGFRSGHFLQAGNVIHAEPQQADAARLNGGPP